MNIAKQIAEELKIKVWQVEAVMELIDEGCTIPFIARYRKEKHGSLNDEQLRNLDERLTYLRNLEERKETVLASIEEQGKLTEELKQQILAAQTQVLLEDLYRPYRPKRRTRATIAKEKGLEGLANQILLQLLGHSVEEEAKQYLDEEKEVTTVEQAISGALDILAEAIADEADYRTAIRKTTMQKGSLVSTAKNAEEKTVYENYYDFSTVLSKVSGYQTLAINRGEKVKILTEDGAIRVFGKNLEQLLMQPPIAGKVVLGWDPAFRTGCKLAVVDETGKVLDTIVVFPTEPQNKVAETKRIVKAMIEKYNISLISVGNGTASRESELVIVDMLKELNRPVQYIITNEAGASVYSASKLATEEFPNFDVGQRSAVSIARRLQDPLAELVKIDPKSIGVGQYQHDMNQKKLSEALGNVVEDCVNNVGVDLNTASASLLEYVSGVSKAIAKNIVTYREENGRFKSRRELLKVAKLGPKAYEQCAGFLRITGGKNPLDATSVHPESYEAATKLLEMLGYQLEDIAGGLTGLSLMAKDTKKLAEQVGIGEITLKDIIRELEKPGRDPRDEMPKPILRSDVLEMKDLKEGMILKGTVRNVIDFGAFVDIGVHQDGLVHISKLTDKKFVKHPLDVVSVGDVVDVKVLQVDMQKKRIQLSMIL